MIPGQIYIRIAICGAAGFAGVAAVAAGNQSADTAGYVSEQTVTAGNPTPSAAMIEVRLSDGRIWLTARQATLTDILTEVAKTAGFELVLLGKIDDPAVPVTIRIDGRTVDKTVSQLTEGLSAMTEAAANDQPMRVWVFGAADGSQPVLISADNDSGEESVARLADEPDGELPPELATELPTALPTELNDPDPSIRAAATEQLYGYAREVAIPALETILETDPSGTVKRGAIQALVTLGDDEAYMALSAGLGDEDTGIRQLTLNSLARIEPDKALQFMAQVVYSDADPDVRLAAVELLQASKNPAAAALLAVAREDSNERVREAAQNASAL